MNFNQQQYLNDYLVEANVLQDPNTMTYNNKSVNTNNVSTTPNSNDTLPLNSNRNSSIQSDNGLIITGNSSSTTTNVSPNNNNNTTSTNALLTNGLPITINTNDNNNNNNNSSTTSVTTTTNATVLPNNDTTDIKNVNKSNYNKLPMNLTMNGSIENSNNNSNNTITTNRYTNDSTGVDTNEIEFPNNNNSNNTNTTTNNNNNGNNNLRNYNKQLYMMNMTNNPHVINDASIQETLSPYFQPFGVDVAHLPMTNPPIFQSSLPVYDEPIPRRRISISNGQISQLGEDIETVENLYNTQPPPLPRYHDNSYNNNNKQQQMINMSQQVTPAQDNMYVPQLQVIPNNQNIRPKQESITSIGYSNNNAIGPTDVNMRQQQYQQQLPQQQYQQNIRQSIPQQQQMNNGIPAYTQQMNYRTENPMVMKQQQQQQQQQQPLPQQQIPDGISPATVPTQLEQSTSRHSMSDINYQDKRIKQEYNEPSNLSNIPSQSSSQQQKNLNTYSSYNRSEEGTPGTTAWKRARLLERNRIAASKCRQRKKVAQLQLQIDYDKISKENAILKKKLVYYEKLISKFKKFTESHFNTCHKTSGSVNDDDKNALKIIQEMLMIDEDIHEVNDNGKIIKLSVKDPSPTIPRSPSQLGDSDVLLDMEGN